MSEPDVHIVNLVRVGGREFLVDVGYGAPFDQPMARDLSHDLAVSLGNEQWVVIPTDGQGRTVVEHHRQGEHIHGYVARPTAREPQHFAQVFADSFRDDSTFMNTIRLVRYSTEVASQSRITYSIERRKKNGAFEDLQIADTIATIETFSASHRPSPRNHC